MPRQVVRDWMSSPVITAHEQTLLPVARSLMAEHKVRRLPVTDDAGHLVGIVTQGDIFKISASPVSDVQDYDLYATAGHLPLCRFMSAPAISASPDESVVEVARRMLAHKISGLPVVENGAIVGIITESNIFRLLIAAEGER